ncbi:unnamed protein product [Ilex paraguariensis]|uniref:Uncharacterized protein n=1 Tax=Ilex paraguariensis TaxID=185542 RepID=A0ABC8SZZ5_9AQUA
MAALNPIDISSSDSESWDLDDYRDLDESPPRESATSANSTNSTILPSWSPAPFTNAMDYQKHSFQQALKKALPTSLQPSGSNAKSSNLVENVESSRIRETYEKSYHSTRPNLGNGKNYMRENFGRGRNGDLVIYENNGSTVLPPSLMHGRHVSTTPYASSSDPLYRPGVGDDRVAETDERLIYQAALQVFLTALDS